MAQKWLQIFNWCCRSYLSHDRKVLDCKIMSKECRTCMLNRLQEGTDEYNKWWENHKDKCHANWNHGPNWLCSYI